MNIAVFVKKTTFHKGYGGLETQNKQLVEGLAKKGHKITVFSPKWEYLGQEEIQNGVRYLFLDSVYRYLFTFTTKHWVHVSYKAFVAENRKVKFDIVISQSSAAWGLFRKKAELEIPIVSVAHGTIIGEIKTYYQDFMSSKKNIKKIWQYIKITGFVLFNFFTRQREFVHGSDKVLVVSNKVKSALIEETFAPEEKFAVIHNGIDFSAFNKNLDLPVGKKVLYVGQVIKSKGLDILFNIALDLRDRDFVFEIIGDGEYMPELKEKVRTNQMSDKFVLRGKFARYENLIPVYNDPAFGVFVLPTKRFEGLPMVLIEASFASLPLIAFEEGGLSDIVVDNENGFLVKPGDVSDFKNKLLQIIGDENLQKKFALNSRKLAEEKFSLDIMISEYEKVLQELVK